MNAPAHILNKLGLKPSDVLSARLVDNMWIIVDNVARKYHVPVIPPSPATLINITVKDDTVQEPSTPRRTRKGRKPK